ncbi:F-box/FBD/LRR-repeat protein At3g52680-like [Oryza brachyantha]|uniref:F-box/FBD/LRR-repeat protein At3g52680-like n=1 Tax=Oryza brachyantha TaxID=4533 RepID=UPI001ADC24D4|nr:F-box/FBD/LRR-repeat protein At3g52680-like [Oryza brachyantha]
MINTDGGADLISRLCDDVLLRILRLLPNAEDVVRTGALSRRWRHLWRRAPVLHFRDRAGGDSGRFVSFVDGVLARRDDAVIEHLAISSSVFSDVVDFLFDDTATAAVNGWIRYGMQRVAKSFALTLQPATMAMAILDVLAVLPGSARLETVSLDMGRAYLFGLPSAAAPLFGSLTDLALANVHVGDVGGDLLRRLFSPACCPRLKKLRLHRISGAPEKLVVDSGELLELSMSWIVREEQEHQLPQLEIKIETPRLRVLRINHIYSISKLMISAPRTEELKLTFLSMFAYEVDAGEMPCVRELNDVVLHLLRLPQEPSLIVHEHPSSIFRCCKFLRRLQLRLHLYEGKEYNEDTIVDMMTDIPQLQHLTYLSVQFSGPIECGLVAITAHLLSQCKFLKHLELDIRRCRPGGPEIPLSESENGHGIILLENLQEISITNIHLRDYEVRLLKFLHASSPALEKMKVTFLYVDCEKLESLGMKTCEEFLLSIANPKEGKCVLCNSSRWMSSYEWMPVSK